MSEPSENHSIERQFEKCPKCGGEMKSGDVHAELRIRKQGDMYGDKIYALYCRDCGFIELYKEPSAKEPWRWPEEQAPLTAEPQHPEKEQPSPETKKRLVR